MHYNEFSAKKTDNVSKIKAVARLSDLIGEVSKLHKSSGGFSCCCPFHNDKSPSMSIDDERGLYYCFGCEASGDIFTFVEQYYQLDFRGAMKFLADRYGIELSAAAPRKPQAENDALIALQERFVAELPKNAAALRYLHSRGLDDAAIAAYGIGYAPSNEQSLQLLKAAGIPPQKALAQGAIKQKDGAFYASFIERITIPISDANGALIGFGGRTMNPENPAKYVNSPSCRLFDKKRVMYGFFAARRAIRRRKMLLVCEGYMDAIAFALSGVDFAVAVLGVGLGPGHLAQISRDIFVRLCFDADSAGRAAAFRAAVLLAQSGYNGDVIALSGAKDAGDFLAAGKREQLREAALTAGQNIIAYAMDYIFCDALGLASVRAHEGADPFAKREAILKILRFARSIDGFLAREHLALFSQRAAVNLDDFAGGLGGFAGGANSSARLGNAGASGEGGFGGAGGAGGGAGGFAGGGGAGATLAGTPANSSARAANAGASGEGDFAAVAGQSAGQSATSSSAGVEGTATSAANGAKIATGAAGIDFLSPTRPSAAEDSILRFCLAHRLACADLLREGAFFRQEVVRALLRGDFEAFAAQQFAQQNAAPLPNAAMFLHNLARLYERACSGVAAHLFGQFAAAAAACERALLADRAALAAAWALLARVLNYAPGGDFTALCEQISALAAPVSPVSPVSSVSPLSPVSPVSPSPSPSTSPDAPTFARAAEELAPQTPTNPTF